MRAGQRWRTNTGTGRMRIVGVGINVDSAIIAPMIAVGGAGARIAGTR
ncbi:hypothetical protein GPL21_34765 [Bradyrhizobium pachyrhizi]|uniref:Uncharacterized protein n=1 Tax=Bradyrhizobium pachyrhizi TaxID=280333 RepID=A0A844T2C6_9BRAD|nr:MULTISPECIES: hypothetical protein [Bradyrhizobium]MVT70244.1 hypothetical protein [Bradyrhizobium pachyrhizi]